MNIHFLYLRIILLLGGILLATALTPTFALDRNFVSGLLVGIAAMFLLFGIKERA